MHINLPRTHPWLKRLYPLRTPSSSNLKLKWLGGSILIFLVLLSVEIYTYHFSNTSHTRPSLVAPRTNETLGFQKIFTLNLPSRTDRQDSLVLAAARAGLDLEFVDGLRGEDVDEVAFPVGMVREIGNGFIGSWRGHMNIIRRIVQRQITTALIMEDDVDWDIRIKEQMGKILYDFQTLPLTKDWDVLWLGHLGDTPSPPLLSRLFTINDTTVPLNLSSGNSFVSGNFPPSTRILHRSDFPLSTLAYAVSYGGAQRMLYHLSVDGLPYEFDTSLANFCRGYLKCWAVTPGVFHEYLPPGTKAKDSNNRDVEEGERTEPLYSQNIGISTRETIAAEFSKPLRSDIEWLNRDEMDTRFAEAGKERFRTGKVL